MNVSEENATFLDRLTIATSPAILKITRGKRDVILAVMIEPTFSMETPPPLSETYERSQTGVAEKPTDDEINDFF